MSWIELIADRKIRDAQEEGRFDDLPGRGRPLHLERDPRTAPEERIAKRLLKDSGFLPDWIELEREIRGRRERLERRVADFAAARAADLAAGPTAADRRRDLFLLRCAEELTALNRAIDRLNLAVPILSRQQVRVVVRERLEELEARFPRASPAAGPALWEALVGAPAGRLHLGNRLPPPRRRSGGS